MTKAAPIPLLIVACAAAAASAQTFQYVSRDSSVSTWGEIRNAPPPSDYYYDGLQSSELGLFDHFAQGGVEYAGVSVGGGASQLSDLLPAAVVATGQADAHVFDDTGLGDAGAWANSLIEVIFDLNAETPVELSGVITEAYEALAPYLVTAHVTLYRGEGPDVELFSAEDSGGFFFSDTLEPGRYFLHCGAFIGNDLAYNDAPATGHAAFELDFSVVPEPASLLAFALATPFLRKR